MSINLDNTNKRDASRPFLGSDSEGLLVSGTITNGNNYAIKMSFEGSPFGKYISRQSNALLA